MTYKYLTNDMILFLNNEINNKYYKIKDEVTEDYLVDNNFMNDIVSVFDDISDFNIIEEVFNYYLENKNKLHNNFKEFKYKSITRCFNKEELNYINLKFDDFEKNKTKLNIENNKFILIMILLFRSHSAILLSKPLIKKYKKNPIHCFLAFKYLYFVRFGRNKLY